MFLGYFKAAVFIFISTTLQAQTFPWDVEIPSDDQVLKSFSKIQNEKSLPAIFEIISWNVEKGDAGAEFYSDLELISHSAHLVLLQEAMDNRQMPAELTRLNFGDIWMAQSFRVINENISTGVATMSKAKAEHVFFRRSPGREPYLKTPKITLGMVYKLSSGGSILVLNIHGINFVSTDDFKNQIYDLLPFIGNFQGKVIFAGDFNTWNEDRLNFLTGILNMIGMTHVRFQNGEPYNDYGFVLDHIFVRGCKVLEARVLDDILSSDHSPVSARLDCH